MESGTHERRSTDQLRIVLRLPPPLTEIVDTLEILDGWEEKYRYILDLGKSLAPLPEAARIESNLVRGCQSQVWLTSEYDEHSTVLSFYTDSDAHIVRGLLAIVLSVYSGNTAKHILTYDIEALFSKLDILSHLSPIRGNGLRSIVQKIRATASNYIVQN